MPSPRRRALPPQTRSLFTTLNSCVLHRAPESHPAHVVAPHQRLAIAVAVAGTVDLQKGEYAGVNPHADKGETKDKGPAGVLSEENDVGEGGAVGKTSTPRRRHQSLRAHRDDTKRCMFIRARVYSVIRAQSCVELVGGRQEEEPKETTPSR